MWVLVAVSFGWGVKTTPMAYYETREQCEVARERFRDGGSYQFLCSKEGKKEQEQ